MRFVFAALLVACSSSLPPMERSCTADDECPTGYCIAGTCRTFLADGSVYCLDRDHDGYGAGCALGDDCDDRDGVENAIEICDGLDNDCDARADEDVARSPCGDCDTSCDVERVGADGDFPREPFELSSSSRDVVVDPDGTIVLAGGGAEPLHLAWIASEDGTVAKIDTRTLRLLARYRSAPGPDVFPPRGVAVGARGDAFVASGDGTVVRIAASLDDCADRDGDGTIETGGPTAIAFEDEECRRWIGHVGGQPGAVAVRIVAGPDGERLERVFVGSDFVEGSHTVTVFELDADDGSVIGSFSVESLPESAASGLTAHDLVVDARGQLWIVSGYGVLFSAPGATLARADTDRCPGSPECDLGCEGAAGDACAVSRAFLPGLGTNCATLDARQRLWLTDVDGGLVYSYDPAQPFGARIELLTPSSLGVAVQGIAADADRRVWVGQDGGLVAYDIASRAPDPIAIAGTPSLSVVSALVDDLGRGWGLSTYGAATIAAIDGEATSVITNAVPELGALGAWCSDPSGAEVRTERGPQGLHIARFDACPGGALRGEARWRWLELGADVASDGFLGLRIRTGTPEEIAEASWIMVPTSPRVDLEALFGRLRVVQGQILEVELSLRTTSSRRPRVLHLDVARSAECDPFG